MSWGKADDEEEDGVGRERAWKRKDAENMRSKQDRQKELTMEQLAFLQKRQKLRRQEAARSETHEPIDLFGGTPFGILAPHAVQEGDVAERNDEELMQMWRSCAERELRILSTPSPRNALEEMILWTKQGKLWQFPVDNEQGRKEREPSFLRKLEALSKLSAVASTSLLGPNINQPSVGGCYLSNVVHRI